mmetsp:Transcript_12352/g.49512  ORF Transcript_12352/g.49512 Transcript_12352/m.49512 type:complete len:209 (+) Transcript_12352:224-850(+)
MATRSSTLTGMLAASSTKGAAQLPASTSAAAAALEASAALLSLLGAVLSSIPLSFSRRAPEPRTSCSQRTTMARSSSVSCSSSSPKSSQSSSASSAAGASAPEPSGAAAQLCIFCSSFMASFTMRAALWRCADAARWSSSGHCCNAWQLSVAWPNATVTTPFFGRVAAPLGLAVSASFSLISASARPTTAASTSQVLVQASSARNLLL